MLWGPHRLFHANDMVSVVSRIRSYYIKKGMIYNGLEWPTLTYNVRGGSRGGGGGLGG